jgi:hypothetical protein
MVAGEKLVAEPTANNLLRKDSMKTNALKLLLEWMYKVESYKTVAPSFCT